MGRWDLYRQIQGMDPERDHQRIMHLVAGWEFPWDVARALEVALHRTFCVPSISKLLDSTGEFHHRAQRRYDDTGLLLTEITEHGYESERGAAAIRRMNQIHARFEIANDDYLYVLSTFHFEPVRWIDRFGWRRMSPVEVEASFRFWREIGRRMGIRDLPATNAEFAEWVARYERGRFAFCEANRRLGDSARELLASWFPRPLRPLVRRGAHAVFDPEVLAALGFPRPSWPLRATAAVLLRARAWIARFLPARRAPSFHTHGPVRSYPHGYQIDRLGPPGMDPGAGEVPGERTDPPATPHPAAR